MPTSATRIKVIQDLEVALGGRLLILFYNTDDRVLGTQLALDVLPPLKICLKSVSTDLNNKKPLFVFLHSSGGILESPWPIVSIIRAATKAQKSHFNVVVNEKAHSAGTLIALGADTIFMNPYASLSPIDPQINISTSQNTRIAAGIEDIQGYYDLIKEIFETNETARAQAFGYLVQRIPAELLGQVQRVHKYIRMLAEKLLKSRKGQTGKTKKQDEEKIVQTLTKEMHSHSYHIFPEEAAQLGLPIKVLEKKICELLDSLQEEYKDEMGIGKDLVVEVPEGQNENRVLRHRAFIETRSESFSYQSHVTVKNDNTAQIDDLGWRKI